MGGLDTRGAKGYYSSAVYKSLIFIKKRNFVSNAHNFHHGVFSNLFEH